MIPLHTGDEICPSFAHARLAASVFVMAEASAKALSLAAYILFHFSGLIKIDCKQHIPLCLQALTRVSDSLWRVPGKNEVLTPAKPGSFDGSVLKTTGVMPLKNKGFPRDVWIWDTGLGSSWRFDSSRDSLACRPCNWGSFGEVPLKNQVLPPDTGKGALKESSPARTGLGFWAGVFDSLEAQAVSSLQNLAVFHSLGYILGRVPLKNQVLPPDTVGFEDVLETIGVMPGILGISWGRLDMRHCFGFWAGVLIL